MSFSPSSIIIVLLSLAVVSLFLVTLHIKGELTKSRQDAAELQTQLDEAIAQRDADRLRIIDAARRLDEALTLFVNNSEEAHYDHETRMENLSNIETNEAVDWLCDPVPDDIRRDFKKTLDKYFNDDEEIYPHAWGSCVTFYKLYHGQRGGLIEADPNHGERISIMFKKDEADLKALAARETQR